MRQSKLYRQKRAIDGAHFTPIVAKQKQKVQILPYSYSSLSTTTRSTLLESTSTS